MTLRICFLSLCCTLISTAALADAKEDAQKKVDEAMAKSCDLAKKAISDKASTCTEENQAMSAVDCAVKEQRKTVDFLKLNGACQKKVRESIESGKGSGKSEGKAEEKGDKPAGKGTHCKAVDGETVVLEHDSEGSAIKCQSELREKMKAEKCEPGKKLELQFIGEAFGKTMKPTSFTITCPRK
jgi:hypothetical protein